MIYKIMVFFKGYCTPYQKEAHSHKSALLQTVKQFSNAVVIGKTVRRYNSNMQLIKGEVSAFKVIHNYHPSILLLVGNSTEIYHYPDEEKRDQIYEELCTLSMPAVSAKSEAEPTDITVSSAATNGSKNGLTFPKIWSGSATNVTWLEKLIPSSTENYFGSDSVKSTAKPLWSGGSSNSPSKQVPTFLATIKRLPKGNPYPSISPSMHTLVGKTISVHNSQYKGLYEGAGWLWAEEWLDFKHITATVKDVPPKTKTNGIVFERYMRQFIGQTMSLKVCRGSYPSHYTGNGYCFAQEWLSTYEDITKTNTAINMEKIKTMAQTYAELPLAADDGTGVWTKKEEVEKFQFLYVGGLFFSTKKGSRQEAHER